MLDPSQRERLLELFGIGSELPTREHAEFCRAECGGDETLRRELQSLLAGRTSIDDYLDKPLVDWQQIEPKDIGEIDGYELHEVIGEGGMGLVLRAEQVRPVRRQVAVKVIKRGMDSAALLARFERERQALAVMSHPGIARVFDAGMTSTGQPYFAMEYVDGLPLTQYCEQHGLGIEERIELLQEVCDGVQHAHLQGVLHRDLKPSNILVTRDGEHARVKIIDFGLARAADPDADGPLLTLHGQVLGTPEYMSPEQADWNGRAIDARTDVYSLGVVLYELLVGERPMASSSLREIGFVEWCRQVREVEPVKPSTRVRSTVSAGTPSPGQQRDKSRMARRLRGDLDWIVMKALAKEPERRYLTPSAFAEDLQRHLDMIPVVAGPDSTGYRLRRFGRRFRGPLIAAGLVLGAIVIGGGVAVHLAIENAALARDNATALAAAQRRAEELQQVSEFQAAQFDEIDPASVGTRLRETILREARRAYERQAMDEATATARVDEVDRLLYGANFTSVAVELIDGEILAPSLVTIGTKFRDQPAVEANLLDAAGCVRSHLGLTDRAEESLRRAVALNRAELGEDHLSTLRSTRHLGNCLVGTHELDEAVTLLRELRQRCTTTLGAEHPETLDVGRALAGALIQHDAWAEAEMLLRELLPVCRRVLGEDHELTIRCLQGLASALQNQDRSEESEPLAREALERMRRVLGDEHRETLVLHNNLALQTRARGRLADAEKMFRSTYAAMQRQFGDGHPVTVTCMGNLGSLLQARGAIGEAESLLRTALLNRRRLYGERDQRSLAAAYRFALLLKDKRELPEAEAMLREALQACRETLGDNHATTLDCLAALGLVRRLQGDANEAESFYREALAAQRRLLGDDHMDTWTTAYNLGSLLLGEGKREEAERLLQDAFDHGSRKVGPGHPLMSLVMSRLARLLIETDRHAEAETMLAPAEPIVRKRAAGNGRRLAGYLFALSKARAGRSTPPTAADLASAAALCEEAEALLDKLRGAPRRGIADMRKSLAEIYDRWHELEPGAGHDQRAAHWRERSRAGDDGR